MSKKRLTFKTYTLYAVDRVTQDYYFVLSVHANTLKAAKSFVKTNILELNRRYPHHHYNFRWEIEVI